MARPPWAIPGFHQASFSGHQQMVQSVLLQQQLYGQQLLMQQVPRATFNVKAASWKPVPSVKAMPNLNVLPKLKAMPNRNAPPNLKSMPRPKVVSNSKAVPNLNATPKPKDLQCRQWGKGSLPVGTAVVAKRVIDLADSDSEQNGSLPSKRARLAADAASVRSGGSPQQSGFGSSASTTPVKAFPKSEVSGCQKPAMRPPQPDTVRPTDNHEGGARLPKPLKMVEEEQPEANGKDQIKHDAVNEDPLLVQEEQEGQDESTDDDSEESEEEQSDDEDEEQDEQLVGKAEDEEVCASNGTNLQMSDIHGGKGNGKQLRKAGGPIQSVGGASVAAVKREGKGKGKAKVETSKRKGKPGVRDTREGRKAKGERKRMKGVAAAGNAMLPRGPVHENLRTGLVSSLEQRMRFRARVVRLGRTRGGRRSRQQETVLFHDVAACAPRTTSRGAPKGSAALPPVPDAFTDHMWLKVGKRIEALRLKPGDKVEFDARVKWYRKKGGHDLKLSHPTKLQVVK